MEITDSYKVTFTQSQITGLLKHPCWLFIQDILNDRKKSISNLLALACKTIDPRVDAITSLMQIKFHSGQLDTLTLLDEVITDMKDSALKGEDK